jgi:hypothetical protein
MDDNDRNVDSSRAWEADGSADQRDDRDASRIAHNGHVEELYGVTDREGGTENERADDTSVPSRPGWVKAGGVLRWEAGDEPADPRAEIDSPLADDDFAAPDGAPDEPRIRAVHAWLARRRTLALEAVGALLLAQRDESTGESDALAARRRPRREPAEPSRLDLALAERQASAAEYEALLAALDEQITHSGPSRALVEFYLWLTEYLAALAAEPAALTFSSSPATVAASGWYGRAQAALATRGRVERLMAPEPEE